MTSPSFAKEMDELKADIESLREQIAGLAAGLKISAEAHEEQARAGAAPDGSADRQEGRETWADLLHKFDSSRVQGEKVVRDLSEEVKSHPLISIAAAFGLGYIIAKLWYQEKKP